MSLEFSQALMTPSEWNHVFFQHGDKTRKPWLVLKKKISNVIEWRLKNFDNNICKIELMS